MRPERTAYHEVGVQPHERRLELVAGGRPVTVRIMEVGNGPATDGPPTVLLLHGVMSASVLFAPLLPYLRQRHVVLVDWPGHGLSGRPSLPHRPDAFRSYTGELFHPMFARARLPHGRHRGHSLGAQLGLYLAIDDPERLRRLTVLGAPGACLPGTGSLPLTPLMAVPIPGRLVLSLPKPESARRRFADKGVGEGRRHALLHGPGPLGDLSPVETRRVPDGVVPARCETTALSARPALRASCGRPSSEADPSLQHLSGPALRGGSAAAAAPAMMAR